MKKLNKNNGITLIALVITIIVMLILVAVSISMAVNGGLFSYAGKATGDTQKEINAEKELADGRIQIGNEIYNSIDEYLESTKPIEGHDGETFSAPYATTVKDNYEDEEKNKATIPAGFSVGTSEGINKISTGLVIRDANGNEFVWIPVSETNPLSNTYSSKSGFSEPKVLTGGSVWINGAYDSQIGLDDYYGAGVFTYETDFKYLDEYAEMVRQVNTYNGFYIGRYETTVDGDGNIGSMHNETILTTSGYNIERR